MDPQSALDRHRHYIDRIDRTIVALLAERMRHGEAVGLIKREQRLPTRVKEREAEVLATVGDAVTGALSAQSAQRIFTVIIEETSAIQERPLDADHSEPVLPVLPVLPVQEDARGGC